jgi:hypothetical protein
MNYNFIYAFVDTSTMKKQKAHGIHCPMILCAQNAAAAGKNIKTWWRSV